MRNMIISTILLICIALVNGSDINKPDVIRCYKEISGQRKPHCLGKYCYKLYSIDDDTGEEIIKRGCMSTADAQTTIGCTSRSESVSKELMCVCNDRHYCNTTSDTRISVFLSVLAILYIVF